MSMITTNCSTTVPATTSAGANRRSIGKLLSLVAVFFIAFAGASYTNAEDPDQETIKEENATKYSDGATVPTEPQLEELLRRARLFAEDGGFRNATVLWSKVLADGGGSLVTDDGETYRSLASVVEQEILSLPPEGLQAYRIIADGEAQALLAQADQRGQEVVLREVVDRYFMSQQGDDAAFALSAIALDRFDLVSARRYLEKIVQIHPDPDIDLGLLFVRLSVCYGGLKQKQKAQQAFQTALKANPPVDAALLEKVSRFLTNASAPSVTELASETWSMPYGNSQRRGMMPSLQASYLDSDLAIQAEAKLDLSINPRQFNNPYQQGSAPAGLNASNTDGTVFSEEWKKHGWRPTQTALVTPNGILAKTSRYPGTWKLDEAGNMAVGWQSLWFNNYRIDDHTIARIMNQQMYGGMPQNTKTPTDPSRVFLFGDRVHQSMAVVGNLVIVLEGQPYAKQSKYAPGPAGGNAQPGFWGPQALRRSRTNWLTAYDATTGKLVWHRSADDRTSDSEFDEAPEDNMEDTPADDHDHDHDHAQAEVQALQVPAGNFMQFGINAGFNGPAPGAVQRGDESVDNGVGFMGPPVAAGDMILAPVTDGGSIWVYGISKLDGQTMWKTHLCDEPSTGANPWSTIFLAVEGQDCYATCGAGVIFSLDVSDGRLRFARRYQRDSSGARVNQPNFGNQMPNLVKFNGWSHDLVIPYQGVLVVLASDSDKLMAFDRSTGAFIWDAPREPFGQAMEYCLGVRGRYLYASGSQSMLCYDLAGQGRLIWRAEFDETSHGFACLTQDAIYVPIKNSVAEYRFESKESGKAKKTAHVGVKGLGDEPLGNLVSDGSRLWAVQPGRLLALGTASARLDQLNQRIEAGDQGARWARLRLRLFQEDPAGWQADLAELLEHPNEIPAVTRQLIASLSWLEEMTPEQREHPSTIGLLIRLADADRNLDASSLTWIERSLARRRLPLIRSVVEHRLPSSQVDQITAVYLFDLLDDTSWILDRYFETYSPEERASLAAKLLGEDGTPLRSAGILLLDGKVPDAWLEEFETWAIVDPQHTNQGLVDAEELALLATFELLGAQRVSGVESAIRLLSAQTPWVRHRAFVAVQQTTGKPWSFNALAHPQSIQGSVAAIQINWGADPNVDSWRPLQRPVPREFGRVLAGFPSTDQLIEFNEQGEILSRIVYRRVLGCVACPNGDRWVSSPQKLERLTYNGDVVASLELDRYPKSLASLPEGGVLVCFSEFPGLVTAYDRDGQVQWHRDLGNQSLAAACLTSDGHLLVSNLVSGQSTIYDENQAELGTLPVVNVNSLRTLGSGNLLVTNSLNGEVLELTPQKRTVFRRRDLPQVRGAIRTPRGLTVVACARGLVALDSDGNEVWSFEEKGAAITIAYH